MILSNVVLTNFGLFRGRHEVQLTPRPSRPIVLFGGKNGAGKSTLLDAIRLCLYGAGSLGGRATREAYLRYLDDKIHGSATLLVQPTFAAVSLEFSHAHLGEVHSYEIARSWERNLTNHVTEHFHVKRDGNAVDDIAADAWQDFVHDLIPPGVSQFFFFDGEKIQQLAEDTSDQETLAAAIKSLLGLDMVERLQADLGIYLGKLVKSAKSEVTNEIEDIESERDQLTKQLTELTEIHVNQQSIVQERRTAIARLEAKIAAEGGAFARDRETTLKKQASLQARISEHENLIRQLSNGVLPFAVAPNLCRALKAQLLLEERALQISAGRDLLVSGRKEIHERVASLPIWDQAVIPPGAKKKLQAALRDALEKPLPSEQLPTTSAIHAFSPTTQRQLVSWIEQATTELPERLRDSTGELDILYRDLQKLQKNVGKTPPDEVLKPLLAELYLHHQQLAEASKEALVVAERLTNIEAQLSRLNSRYEQAIEQLSAQVNKTSRIQMVPRIQNVLLEYKTSLIQKKVTELQEAVSDCFNALSRKKDVLRRIVIDPKDFSVMLYDRQERTVPKAQLSAGEKQIYSIAMLWALAKVSGRQLPIIVDTPLARLDSDHRRLLIEEYFPAASHQVLILSTDTEVDQTYFTALRRSISHTYHLEYDPSENASHITNGYFWKTTHEADEAASYQRSV